MSLRPIRPLFVQENRPNTCRPPGNGAAAGYAAGMVCAGVQRGRQAGGKGSVGCVVPAPPGGKERAGVRAGPPQLEEGNCPVHLSIVLGAGREKKRQENCRTDI